ncbi:hypothetical protein GPECTOR_1g160 [Gonium pectorale]|uniref:Uncharacterized protein n=1 Tax=Gonium pectorale TaxID=33097 RepID=A0A150H207_GONPE|nr:hypothetical protein GPECTOR_1g160 [Gonium pectorale]|eukprot:KXZ56186.1 hypothetical protein GPECTOR_1g160 [Gonium pectorale]
MVNSSSLKRDCVGIAEGQLGHDGAFYVRALTLPSAKPRAELPAAVARLNLWGGSGGCHEPDSDGARLMAEEEAARGAADRVVVLANVWLDRPEVLESLHAQLSGERDRASEMQNLKPEAQHCKPLPGGGAGGRGGGDSVLPSGKVDYGVMRELFGQLAAKCPRLSLRYANQRVVLFRHDLQRRLRRRALLPLGGFTGAPQGCLPSGHFAAYLPCMQQVEMSELPRPGEEPRQAPAQQQQLQRVGQKGKAAAGGGAKPRKPRGPKQGAAGAGGRQTRLPAGERRPASEAAAAGADGAADSGVEMVEPDANVAAASAVPPPGKAQPPAKAKPPAPRQGILAMAWAKPPMPARPEDGLEDEGVDADEESGEGAAGGEDG